MLGVWADERVGRQALCALAWDSGCRTIEKAKVSLMFHQVCYSIATVVSAVALAVKIKVLRAQIIQRRYTFDQDPSGSQRKLYAHRRRLVLTERAIQSIYASMLVGIFECVPLGALSQLFPHLSSKPCSPQKAPSTGVLQSIFVQRASTTPTLMNSLSLITWALGCNSMACLFRLWPYFAGHGRFLA